jgi:hypothetical protein
MADGNGTWRVIVAVLASGGLASIASILANDHDHAEKPDRIEIEHIIETARPIVVLQKDVERLVSKSERDQQRNEEQHVEILLAIESLKP